MPPKSNTVVVGLLPPQARRIADEFRNSGLKFIPRDREGELHTLVKGFDNVVVMTKFISHSTWFLLPREKIRPVNGGLSDLKRKLRSILPVTKQTARTRQPGIPMASEVDYSTLRDAAPGQVVLLTRPVTTTVKRFGKQVSAMRSYYKRNHGVETTSRVVDQGIELFVVSRAGVTADGEAKDEAKVKRPADDAIKQFWTEAYLRLIMAQPGASDEAIAARADAAVAAFRERFT